MNEDLSRRIKAAYDAVLIDIESVDDGGSNAVVCNWSEVIEAIDRAKQSESVDDWLVDAFCEAIEAGKYDDWLEKILAAGHDRKRARRGTKELFRQVGER